MRPTGALADLRLLAYSRATANEALRGVLDLPMNACVTSRFGVDKPANNRDNLQVFDPLISLQDLAVDCII